MLSDFKYVKLSDCLTIRHGKNQKKVEVDDGQFPILGTGGEIGRTNTPLYSKPSVLIGRKGTIDKPRYMQTPFWTVDTLFYTEIKDHVVPKYIFYVFKTINWHQYNEASGVPSLSATTISSIKVKIPLKSEQLRIVALIEAWDAYIEKLDQKIEVKRRIKTRLMQELLTGKKRIPGFSGKWKSMSLGEILVKLTDYTANGSFAGLKDNVRYYSEPEHAVLVRTTDLEKATFVPQRFTDIKGYKYLKKTSLYGGELIMANVGNIGKVYRVPYYDKPMTLAPNTYLLEFDETAINKEFIYQVMLTKSFQNKVLKMVGGGGGLVAINKANFRNISAVIPSDLNEQIAIANVLTHADKELIILEKYRNMVNAQRKYLVNNLISGKIRIPDGISDEQKETTHA